mmetsp:Transcript_9223/g.56042  ORF Transcript_9223/g.56042 Transcript_9223/m.56042 type:complete len:102 (+) Transcript_9223:133-438(+)
MRNGRKPSGRENLGEGGILVVEIRAKRNRREPTIPNGSMERCQGANFEFVQTGTAEELTVETTTVQHAGQRKRSIRSQAVRRCRVLFHPSHRHRSNESRVL